MTIARNAGSSSGKYLNAPGEYVVKVGELKTGMSKKGKLMLTVTFNTADEKSVRAYFVTELPFHMKSLDELKNACGLKPGESADNLVGKECGILLEAQEPTENGVVFMHIVGYGPASEVSHVLSNEFSSSIPGAEQVPF